jgi:aspartate/methionine/tyrosine aminotransferase
VNGPEEERQKACSRLELILDTYLSVSAPVQQAAEALLAIGDEIQNQIRYRIVSNLSLVDERSAETPVQRLHSEGGWSVILRVPKILSEEEWITNLLIDNGVIVQPGYFFDMPGEAFLVVSLLTPEAVLRAGLEAIHSIAIRQ